MFCLNLYSMSQDGDRFDYFIEKEGLHYADRNSSGEELRKRLGLERILGHAIPLAQF